MAELYAVSITEFPGFLMEPLLNCVAEKRERLSRLQQEKDRIRGLLGDLLVRKVISQALNIPYFNLRFARNAYGKPFLCEGGLEFNISHSGDWVVCAVSKEPVGIDIEKKGTVDLELARRFFAKDEDRYIREQDDEESQLERFYQVWSAKESLIKAVGRGLSQGLDTFSVVSDYKLTPHIEMDGVIWNLTGVSLDSGYSLYACTAGTNTCEKIEIIDVRLLIEEFLS
ncbi:4'-phosphopantetheinyl transferase superfamily protein [Paenibacillus sp. FSL R7-0273]|uniref:4'-phosphopantetheinyl transferase family protein n=1 Tax=Paenibacillus sp. FSL R7-0273 TaxID=1536772 RepID=UPI0006943746|nr:4'-phosphopantetheinyl transferase superfamily protein [Paenibacillus sp. FSL R7-0273]OMF85290.1 hypothetical protein BK144_28110 [Paenibacillus sp. FSL R7-0273]